MEIFFEIKADNVEYLQAILNSDISPDHTFKNNGNRSIPEIFNDETPIISIASFYGSLKCLSFLTEKGADINKFSQNKFRFIPIHYSIAGNQQKSFDFLLNHNSNKNGIIFAAVHFLNLDMFNFIIENKLDDVNYSDEFVRAPIIEAVEKKSIKIASVLLQNSANFTQGLVDSCQKSKEFKELFNSFQDQLIKEEIGITTPLHTAADQNNYEEAKRIIEEGKIDINAVNQNGDTALMKASHRGSLQIVKLLLEQPNIDINHKNKGGKTALHHAALYAKKDVVLYLLHFKGIDPFIRTSHGRTVLHCAARRCKCDIIDPLLQTGQLHPNQQDDKIIIFF